MGIKLVIAEKPSLAKAIRAAVGDEYTICNARGHIYEQSDMDFYLPNDIPKNAKGKKIWRRKDLPVIPQNDKWTMLPKGDCAKEIGIIKDLLKTADLVVNAGDPDREGQLLIDEILSELKYKGPVKRVWLMSLVPESIKESFNKMKDNKEYFTLSESAKARSHADWLVGLNLTRAWTLKAGNLTSVGRVQTPTLSIIVSRDLGIENFKPRDFFEVRAQFTHVNGSFIAKWQPANKDGTGFDEEGRLISKSLADTIARKAGAGSISECNSEVKKRGAPLPFNLSALQKKADAVIGMGAQEVLDAAQRLYDEGLTSYPRSDCQFLGADQHATLASVADDLATKFGVKTVNIKHHAFNDSKVTAHTAIVPTGKDASMLRGNDAKLYDLIAKSIVAIYMPPEEFKSTSITVLMGGDNWTAAGKQVTSPGWTALYGKEAFDEDDEKTPKLPEMKKSDGVTGKTEVKSLKTNPPKRLTEGTLIDAMANIHRYIEDPKAKSMLKETAGIGTEATRANVIETLFRREWIKKEGKSVISTQKGRDVIASIPKELSDPVTTAKWEERLSDIAAGKINRLAFEGEIVSFIKDQLLLTDNSVMVAQKNFQSRRGAPAEKTGKEIYLNVPYSEKDVVKKLGARWDGEKKKWFITNNDQRFKEWLSPDNK